MSEHLLLTVLGTRLQETSYMLRDEQCSARLAPVALYSLLAKEDRPQRLMAVCTASAKCETLPYLEQAMAGLCEVNAIDVPAGESESEVDQFLNNVAEHVAAGAELTLDLTHGFRHLTFLTYFAVLYLSHLRSVKIRGAWYGMLREGSSPFLDLRPLLDLPKWLHALATFRETGSALPIANLLESTPNRDLKLFSEAYLSGLPLEAGLHAQSVCDGYKPLLKQLKQTHRLPLSEKLAEEIIDPLKRLTVATEESRCKGSVVLTKEELERQALLIDQLLEHGSHAVALGLMSEWTVSWIACRRKEERWLERDTVRMSATNLLHAIDAIGKDPELRNIIDEKQRGLGNFWRQLKELRNGFAHHGMRKQKLVGKEIQVKIKAVKKYWDDTLKFFPQIPVRLGGTACQNILISPLGMRPGVVFSAIKAVGETRIDLCLFICSKESSSTVAEALSRAGYDGSREILLLEDAHGGGRPEIDRLTKEAKRLFIGADKVFVNVTGGTTLMGLAAESLAKAARSLACPTVRRFGLIDRRKSNEQENDPYQVGEPFWLDEDDDQD